MTSFVDVLIPPLPEPFSYRVPKESSAITVGFRVTIPFGNRKTFGYVVSKSNVSSFKDQPVKPNKQEYLLGIEELKKDKIKSIDPSFYELCFAPSQLDFFKKVSEYYGSPLSNVIDVAIPPTVPEKSVKSARIIKEIDTALLKGNKAREIFADIKKAGGNLSLIEISRSHKNCNPAIKKLTELGAIEIDIKVQSDSYVSSENSPSWAAREVSLNPEQETALNIINQAQEMGIFKTVLLHGVTGSGKTEVYIEAAAKALAKGKGVIIVVPEIALTPQLIDRFKARLGNNIASLHSGLNKRIRWDSWKALLDQRCKIAIGARSAIFAPIENIGLIIVDEEHDSSYKQSEGLRYNARDMAILMGQLKCCPVVLGSATPSLESYYKARSSKFTLSTLNSQFAINSGLKIEVVDLRQLKPWEMASQNISPMLLKTIEDAVVKREQVFLLYNRRGFASFLQCDKCGETVQCPNCSVTLTYHNFKNSLVCHYCGIHVAPFEFCSVCPDQEKPGALIKRGGGTEKIFEEVRDLFPDVIVDRLDRDTVSNIDSYKVILDRVRSGKTGILVGTQMIAKGHDLPNVTVVGVIDCDVGIHMPDFRATERAFQLLTQVAGRAGRGDRPGKVILQTRMPEHPSIVKTVERDYVGLAKIELGHRQQLGYPPFSRLLRIIASSENEELPQSFLAGLKVLALRLINERQMKVTVLGPAPAPLQKLKSLWRWHLLIKSESPSAINLVLQSLMRIELRDRNIKLIFDVDPQEML